MKEKIAISPICIELCSLLKVLGSDVAFFEKIAAQSLDLFAFFVSQIIELIPTIIAAIICAFDLIDPN
jgi:hypothetical protein